MAHETPTTNAPHERGQLLTEKAKAILAGTVARDKLADDVVVLDVASLTTVSSFLVICSAESVRQVKAVAEAVDEALLREGVRLLHREGVEYGRWILLDYGDVIVHVFHHEVRAFYHIERLWGDASPVALPGDRPLERRRAARFEKAELL